MTEKLPVCPVCEKGDLNAINYSDTFKHNGQPLHVHGLEGCECAACGADPILTDQIKRNDRRILEAKRLADGLLTGEEIRLIRERLGLTQRQAAKIFGGGTKAFTKYEGGVVMQSAAMDTLLRLVDRHPALLTEAADLRGIDQSVPTAWDGAYRSMGSIRVVTEKRYPSRPELKVICNGNWEKDAA